MEKKNTNVEAWNANLQNFLPAYEGDLLHAVAIQAEEDIYIKH